MTRQTDLILTIVLLLPMLALGTVAASAPWRHRPRRGRRLTGAEMRRMYRITAERAGKYQSN